MTNEKEYWSSASAIETADPKADGCYRKHYFQKVMKLPRLPFGASTFGEVIHSVCERYLEADDNGNVNGEPVELYPKDWESPINRYTGLPAKEQATLPEQALIKALIVASISEGVLMRVEGREIEKELIYSPMAGVKIKGYIDLLEPGAIRDHKSTKSMKWAKSVKRKKDRSWPKAALALNIQLNLYAHWYYTAGEYDKALPVKISHQYYLKDLDKPHVEKREVELTWPEVEKFFTERIAPVLEMMMVYRDAETWQDVPLPCNVSASCRKFGGCEFQTICTEQETVKEYRKRIEQELTGKNETNYKQVAHDLQKEGDPMAESAMMKKIRRKEKAKAGGARPTATPTPVAQEAAAPPAATLPPIAPPAAPAETTGKQRAPWYIEGCKLCTKNDILGMKKGNASPCVICDSKQKKLEGGLSSEDYIWEVDAGVLEVFTQEGEPVITLAVAEPATAKEVVAAPVEEVKLVEEVKPIVNAVPPIVNEAPAVQKAAEAPAVQGEGTVFEGAEILTDREKFKVMIGVACTESRVKGGGKFGSPSCRITSEELVQVVQNEMIKLLTATRWQSMNSFERRDAVGVYGEQIALMLGSSTIIVATPTRATLEEAIIKAIRPYAGEVWQALAQ